MPGGGTEARGWGGRGLANRRGLAMAALPVDRPEGRVHQGGRPQTQLLLRGTRRPHPTLHCAPRTSVEAPGQRVGPYPGAPPGGCWASGLRAPDPPRHVGLRHTVF